MRLGPWVRGRGPSPGRAACPADRRNVPDRVRRRLLRRKHGDRPERQPLRVGHNLDAGRVLEHRARSGRSRRDGRPCPRTDPSLDAGGGLLTGLAFDDEGHLYVAAWPRSVKTRVTRRVPGRSPGGRVDSRPQLARLQLPERAGVPWRVPLRLRQLTARSGAPVRRRDASEAPSTPWLEDPVLASGRASLGGLNGIAFLGNSLYAVNADTGSGRSGSPCSAMVRPVHRSSSSSDPALVAADGDRVRRRGWPVDRRQP